MAVSTNFIFLGVGQKSPCTRSTALKRDAMKMATPSGEALANMVLAAVKGLDVDVVVYDGEVL